EGPDVGALVDRLTSRLLRAHVRGGAENRTHDRRAHNYGRGLRHIRTGPFGREGFCETEVQHLDYSIGRDLDVGRFEIAMDDPGPVRGVQCVGDLLRESQSLREWQRAP